MVDDVVVELGNIEKTIRVTSKNIIDEWLPENNIHRTRGLASKVTTETKNQLTKYLARINTSIDYKTGTLTWSPKNEEEGFNLKLKPYFELDKNSEMVFYDDNPTGMFIKTSEFSEWLSNKTISAIEVSVFTIVIGLLTIEAVI